MRPPILTSAAYATDLNEVQAIGKSDSATRTPDQTAIARLWASIAASLYGGIHYRFDQVAARRPAMPSRNTCSATS